MAGFGSLDKLGNKDKVRRAIFLRLLHRSSTENLEAYTSSKAQSHSVRAMRNDDTEMCRVSGNRE